MLLCSTITNRFMYPILLLIVTTRFTFLKRTTSNFLLQVIRRRNHLIAKIKMLCRIRHQKCSCFMHTELLPQQTKTARLHA